MLKKTLIAEFFTTISFRQFLNSLLFLTFKIPFIRYWKYRKMIEERFLDYIWTPNSKTISFYNWRSAIYHCLKMIWVKKDDEVIVSSYTCVSVSNAVLQAWAKIIYTDVNKKNLWFDIKSLEKSITKNTKAIIVQHTFWKASDIEKIIALAKQKKIIVIEDSAHGLWSSVNFKKLWTFWDFAIFSTWRDKVISSVSWWFLLINNKKYFDKIDKVKNNLKMPSVLLTIKNLNYNIFAYLAFKTYSFLNLWKIIIFLSRKFRFITEILEKSEKKCEFKNFQYDLPNSLAYLVYKELENIENINNHRKKIADYYNKNIENDFINVLFNKKEYEENNYFRYPIILKSKEQKDKFYDYMKKNNILLWKTWSWQNIVPIWSNLNNARYDIWSCPVAEDISKRILTLPNHCFISISDAGKITNLLNNFEVNV